MGETLGTAVLELTTNSASLVSDLQKVKAELRGVAETTGATSQAATADWATMAQAITAVSKQLAEQKAHTQELRTHTSELGSTFTELKGTLTEVAGAFGVALSIASAIEFLKTVADEAAALKNLSLQTQINIEDLQVLAAATKDYGVSGDELARALFNLKQRIAGGDDSVATAYHLMGKSLEEVKNLNAFDLFVQTERGLGNLHGTIRDTAAADLYGGKLGSSLTAFSTGVDDAIEKARTLNKVASEESVKAAAEYSTAIDRAKASLHAWAMEVEGKAAQELNVLTDAVHKGASEWSLFYAVLADNVARTLNASAGPTALATALDHLNQTTNEGKDIELAAAGAAHSAAAGHQAVAVALSAEAQAAVFMAALRLDATKALTTWQEKDLAQLKELGELNAKNAAAISVSVDQFNAYVAAQERAKEAQRKADEEAKKAFEAEQAALAKTKVLWDEYYGIVARQSGNTTAALIADINKWYDTEFAAIEKLAQKNIDAYGALDALNAQYFQKLQGVAIDTAAIAANSADTWKENLQSTADKAAATFQFMVAHADSFRADTIASFRDIADQAARAADNWYQSWNAHLDELDAHIAETDASVKAAADAAASAAQAARGTIAAGATNPYDDTIEGRLAALRSTQGQGFVSTAGLFSGLPGRAGGGPVAAGVPYIVGEKRPEVFVPGQSGTILPGLDGGGVTVNLTVNGSVLSDPDKLSRAVKDAIEHGLRKTGVRIGGR